MGKLTTFDIVFADAREVFYPGDVIKGHVNLKLSEPMDMRGIQLNLAGRAYVGWSESRRNGSRYYSDMESYFNQDILLHGIWSGQGNSTTVLRSGRHSFPFQSQLPQSLPSSFEGKKGYVRYTAKCTIDKPWKFNHKTKKAFTVIQILDLNSYPHCKSGTYWMREKHLGCLCCKSGPISATFSIEQQGFVPGQVIKFNADITNGSRRKVDQSYVNLDMLTIYHAEGHIRLSVEEMARVTRPGIESHSEDLWIGEEMIVPPLPPSHLNGCKLIDISYILKLNVDPSGPSLDLEIPLDITIGSIPFSGSVQQSRPLQPGTPIGPAENYPQSSASSTDVFPPSTPPSDIPDYPPPSYAECVTGKVDISEDDDKYTHGNLRFAPLYLYYDWRHRRITLPPNTEERRKRNKSDQFQNRLETSV